MIWRSRTCWFFFKFFKLHYERTIVHFNKVSRRICIYEFLSKAEMYKFRKKRHVWPKTFVQHKLCSKKKSQSFFIFFMIWFEMQFIYFYVSCITIISNWGNYWDWWDIYYEKSNLRMHLKNECTTKNNTKFDI